MAEAFARRYGTDVVFAKSAGLHPATMVSPVTARLMFEKNIDLEGSVPKGLDETGTSFDLIVNMSGQPLPGSILSPVREWDVEDPIGLSEERHREVRDRIESLVQNLILELRRKRDRR
jgi:protein-tyrosine-phosphatase